MPLKKLINKYKQEYLTVITFSLVINLLMLAPSWYMLEIYDRVLTSFDKNTLYGLTLIVVFIYLVSASLENYRSMLLVGISEKIDHLLINNIYDNIITSKNKKFNPINDLNNIKQFMTGGLMISIIDLPWFFIYLLVIFLVHKSLAIISIISALLLVFLAAINHKLTSEKLVAAQDIAAHERAQMFSAINARDSIKSMGMDAQIKARLMAYRKEFLTSLIDGSIKGIQLSSLSKFLRLLIQSGTLGFGAYLAIDNQISGGMIIAASILLGRMLAPIEGIINAWKQIPEYKNSFKNLEAALANQQQKSDIVLGKPQGDYLLEDVTIHLRSNASPAIDKMNIKIQHGRTLAVIGPSGAGKTTLLKLLAGIFNPDNGKITLDSAEISTRKRSDFGEYIGYLGQNLGLIEAKISENICRLNQINNDFMVDAAKKIGAHEFIIGLPDAYDTNLSENGSGLSEGQSKKIALARAIYGDPEILLLDEPGAGLDEQSISYLQKMILDFKSKRKTVIFTTHQTSLISVADDILLIMNGKISLYGPKDAVLKKLSGTEK